MTATSNFPAKVSDLQPQLPEGYTVRQASNSDIDAVRAMVFAVLAEYRLCGDPGGIDSDLNDIESNYINTGGMFDVVVHKDGGIVGSVGISARDPSTCELRKMYLAREVRGHGLGKLLLERAIAFARRRGFVRIELETASILEQAIRMYTNAGFRPIASTHLAARCDQAYALDLRDWGIPSGGPPLK